MQKSLASRSKMFPLVIKAYEPNYQNTLYLDKDGVLNKAYFRSEKVSSPRTKDEILVKKDLLDIFEFSKKKNLI